MSMIEDQIPDPEKVVIQFGAKQIKGYLESPHWNSLDELLGNSARTPPQTLRVRHLDSGSVEEIPISGVKAVFYVNTFEGDSEHKELNFHSRAPIAQGIWMKIQFIDGEVMEGLVQNSIHYLVDPGFFLIPTDPGSNNRLVYVAKDWLADHRVLGLRKL